jgi:hypothetical protein
MSRGGCGNGSDDDLHLRDAEAVAPAEQRHDLRGVWAAPEGRPRAETGSTMS